jgi:DNA polymerase-3 subunit delta'
VRLDGLLGQKRAQTQLEAELESGRLAHAYLFVGPKGTGRATAARALFKSINCEQRQADRPCGVCANCHRLQAGTHEDFVVMAPPSGAPSAQIKVDEVRQAIRTLSFAPFAGGTRLVLIREAGHLNPTSANVLLKTLEEPPPNNILVLTVQDPAQLLPTLVSRCRRVNFAPLDTALVAEELTRRGIEPRGARLRAALSGGSLGRALDLDEEALSQELERLRRHLDSKAGPMQDWAFAEEVVADYRGAALDRQGLADALELWAQFFRDLAVTAAGRPDTVMLPRDLLPPAPLAESAEAYVQVRRAQSQILANASPELVLVVLLGSLQGSHSAFAAQV